MSLVTRANLMTEDSVQSRRLVAPVLHRASWVVPVSVPPIPDGAVLVHEDQIQSVGPYRHLKSECPSGTVESDHGDAALIPALVNGHTHLELSAFRGAIELPKPGFPAWLTEVFRVRSSLTQEAVETGFHEGCQEMVTCGTALSGDITNGVNCGKGAHGARPEREVFLELIGFNSSSLESALQGTLFEHCPQSYSHSLAAHACYSTSAAVIQEAKTWCRRRKKIFSIHVAEHPQEMEFLREGTGYCRALLESLGKWAPCWAPPRMTPVGYLKRLGVLDASTLLVHTVHLTDTDWEIVAKSGAAVCFCPRSNRNIGVGTAHISSAVQRGIPICLGTDSHASNFDLNLFTEGLQVMEDFPGIPPDFIVAMLTLGGARALGRHGEYGALEVGKRAAFLAVALSGSPTSSVLSEAVIHQGNEGAIRWVTHPKFD